MKKEFIFCDKCEKQITKYSKKHGICIIAGYSKNGWGQRSNALNWSGEVCEECFEHYEKCIKKFMIEFGAKNYKGTIPKFNKLLNYNEQQRFTQERFS